MNLCTILYGIYSRTSAQLSRCPMITAIIATPLTKSNVRFLFVIFHPTPYLNYCKDYTNRLHFCNFLMFKFKSKQSNEHLFSQLSNEVIIENLSIIQLFYKLLDVACFTFHLITFIQCGITEGRHSNSKTYKRFNKDIRRQHK